MPRSGAYDNFILRYCIIIMFHYAIMAARHTVQHTHIHANTSTKKTQKTKKWQNGKKEQTDKTRATLGPTILLWRMCPIQPALLFAGWRESTTNRTDSPLQQIFAIPNVAKKIAQNYQKWAACSNKEVFVDAAAARLHASAMSQTEKWRNVTVTELKVIMRTIYTHNWPAKLVDH